MDRNHDPGADRHGIWYQYVPYCLTSGRMGLQPACWRNLRMSKLVWALVLLLVVLHQDNWLWNNDRLVLGFLPIGLCYHACISIAAGIVWFLATKFCWPTNLEVEHKS